MNAISRRINRILETDPLRICALGRSRWKIISRCRERARRVYYGSGFKANKEIPPKMTLNQATWRTEWFLAVSLATCLAFAVAGKSLQSALANPLVLAFVDRKSTRLNSSHLG